MNKRILTIIAAAVLALTLGELRADTIELHGGKTISTDAVTFDGSNVILPDGSKIPLGEVKKISLVSQESAAANASVTDGADVNTLLSEAKRGEKLFPDAKSITLVDTGVLKHFADGKSLYRYHGAILIRDSEKLSLMGQSNWIEEGRNRVTIIMARSIAPDGAVQNLDKSTIKQSKPAGDSANFDEGMSLSYQIPGVRLGSIVEFIYEDDEYNPFDKVIFWPSWFFGSEEPVLDSQYTVMVPENAALFWSSMNIPEDKKKPEETVENGWRKYYWRFKDTPGIVKEPMMPDTGDVIPRIEGFMFGKDDWDYIKKYAKDKFDERMQIAPEIENAANTLTADAKTDEEKIAALYSFVQRDIQYISIKGSTASGMFGHTAQHTLKNGYGDCIDKAILFSTLLRAAGITAFPIWLSVNPSATSLTEFPNVGGNHAITEIHHKNRIYYLDATAEYYNYRYPYFREDDHGVAAINPLLGTVRMITVPQPEDYANMRTAEMTILSENEAQVKFVRTFTGGLEAEFRGRFEKQDPDQLKQYVTQLVNYYNPGSTVEYSEYENVLDMSKQIVWRLGVKMTDFGTRAGKLVIFRPPAYMLDFEEAGLEERKYDIEYTTSELVSHDYVINVPDTLKIKYVPEEISVENKHASYKASYKIEGNKIIFKSEYKRWDRVVPAADYKEYRKFLQTVSAYAKKQIFLETE
jgi:transglutaminase-like putative cysteine protease